MVIQANTTTSSPYTWIWSGQDLSVHITLSQKGTQALSQRLRERHIYTVPHVHTCKEGVCALNATFLKKICHVQMPERGFLCVHTTLGVCAWQCTCVGSQTIQHALSNTPGHHLSCFMGNQTPFSLYLLKFGVGVSWGVGPTSSYHGNSLCNRPSYWGLPSFSGLGRGM